MGKKSVRKNRTKTRSFGASSRLGHDATIFYSGKIYSDASNFTLEQTKENTISPNSINKIFCKSSEKMDELPDSSIHLMVTSPPYNVGKDYDENLSIDEYS